MRGDGLMGRFAVMREFVVEAYTADEAIAKVLDGEGAELMGMTVNYLGPVPGGAPQSPKP